MKTNFKFRSFQFQKPILLIGILLISLSSFGAIIPRLKHGENLKLAAIGTSLTDKGSGNKGWFEHTGEWLNTLQYKGKATWSNHAVGGSASKTVNSDKGYHPGRYGLLQLSDVLANENPDAIFIEFAINDAFLPYNISQQASEENLQMMIDQIHEWAKKQNQGQGKKVDIIVQTMNNCIKDHANKRPNLEQYYEGYKKVAKRNRDVLFVDNYANWMKLYNSQPDHAIWHRYVPDGIHPNAKGDQEILIRQLQKKLKKQ